MKNPQAVAKSRVVGNKSTTDIFTYESWACATLGTYDFLTFIHDSNCWVCASSKITMKKTVGRK